MRRLLLAFLLLPISLFAQSPAPTSTTLSMAVNGPSQSGAANIMGNIVFLASNTGIVASAPGGAPAFVLYVDREAMGVVSVSASTGGIGVIRGYMGTQPSAHNSGATVLYGRNDVPQQTVFFTSDPAGACVSTNAPNPWINVITSTQWKCTGGVWVATAGIFSTGTGLPAGCTSPASAQLKCSIFIDTTSVTNVGASAQALNLYVSGACDGVSACTGNFWGIVAPASMSASIQYTGNSSDAGGGPLQSDAAQHLSVPGDANHSPSPVTTGSGTSIGSTSFCSTTNCPSGTYVISTYIDITTACTTTGTYIVNLIYTDDQGSKTIPINIQGTGTTPATGSLALSSTANFGQATQVIHTTGAASINYSTTATACGTGGPMVGKLYLSALRVGL